MSRRLCSAPRRISGEDPDRRIGLHIPQYPEGAGGVTFRTDDPSLSDAPRHAGRCPGTVVLMRPLIDILDSLAVGIRTGSLAVLLLATVIATLAWAERSRRLDPFGSVARFVRKVVDPLLAPVERRLGRTGVAAANMPFLAVLVLLMVMAGAVFIVGGVRDALASAHVATSRGPSGLLALAVRWTFGVLQLALLVRVITSWVGGTYSTVGRLAVRLTEWFLAPLRRVLPPMGGFDISPILAWFLLGLVQRAFFTLL